MMSTTTQQLDLPAIVKALQSISRELLLPNLQERLMRVALELSGAQCGKLLLVDDDQLSVHAQAEVKGEEIVVEVTAPIPFAAARLPHTIVGYVRRTKERVMLSDALDSAFAATDEYITLQQPRAIVCLPIVRQTTLVGILYLENKLITGAFTPEALSILEMLASQAAISLQNAALVANLQEENAKRKRVEAGMEEHYSTLRGIIDGTDALIFSVDRQYRYTNFNKAHASVMEAIYGVEIEIGRSLLDYMTVKEDREKAKRHIDRALAGEHLVEEAYSGEELLSRRFFRVSHSPLRTDDGTVIGVAVVSQDMTERRQAEEVLRLQTTALRSSANAIAVTDRHGTITSVNPAITRLTGYTSEELIGKTFRILKSGRHPDSFYKSLWDTILSGIVWHGEIVNKRKDGSLYTEEMTITPVRDNENVVTHFVAVKQDVTEKKNLQEQLLQAQKMESIGTLAGGIAHDFNNILGIILAYSTALQSSHLSLEQVSKNVEAIEKAVGRGADLVRQILTFARKSETVYSLIDVNAMLKEISKMMHETFPRTIQLTLDLDATIPAMIADAAQVHQSILNLCVNARDAMPNGGILILKTTLCPRRVVQSYFPEASDEQYVRVSVADTGVGMDDATKRRIFEPFFSTKERGKGTGLGLAVVYGAVKNHRGFIRVESEIGFGSTFFLYLPLPPTAATPTARPCETEGLVEGGNETLLLVEDEELLLDMLKAIVEGNGYRVLTARDGEEAVQVYGEHKEEIDLVFSDLGLPKMTGEDAFARMRELNPNIQLIVATGYIDPETKARLLKAGARDVVSKPYILRDLLRSIRAVLDARNPR